jgi:hypothetical protein
MLVALPNRGSNNGHMQYEHPETVTASEIANFVFCREAGREKGPCLVVLLPWPSGRASGYAG